MRTRNLWPYLLIAPTVAGGVFLLLYPLLRAALISVQHFRMGELVRGGARLTGLDNYRELLAAEEFWAVTLRTFGWTAVNVVLIVGLSTAVALMLARLGRRMRVALMSVLALVWATPVIAATTIFQWLFQSELGIVNRLLVALGFDSFQGHSWFADGGAMFGVLVALVVWQSVPFAALTLYAGLTTIPAELYESARIDGGTGPQIFARVTFPILRPMFALVTSLEVIWVFKCFPQIWVLGQGGPDGATTTLPVYAFKVARVLHRYDLGSAVAMLTVAVLAVALAGNLRRMLRQEGAGS
ncbi:sugar ABC transporter permease [Planomonospora sphaerica]|uniref:Sugar ABC transporter permease n=3 Tax=Planomonospora TaxID=1998 RepID=A0A171DLQ6_9ACTN|nr:MULTISPECIES: sugar ABC transporter permease [Planomonospora]GAT69830.1 sugar ABC transporter permease [Planomonospora sphaerica]GGK98734.1 sugar ABC transporter permease [Planomonospora parontospora]GII12899.1 sugar ABC transporter permease [Planomonospora parontospora subsp. parontospora]